MLKVTHLSRRRSACPWPDELDDGWFLRFAGPDQDEWNEFKDELKSRGWDLARWIPKYRWDDGREGAWWIEADEIADLSEWLSNLHEARDAIEGDDALQWTFRRSSSYTSRREEKRTRGRSAPKTSVKPIPSWLTTEYALLELSGAATMQDCKDAYRRLSKVHHPDAGGTHYGFIALQRAYEAVSRWLTVNSMTA